MASKDLLVDFKTLSLKISRSENLPILPNVVLHLLQLFGQPDVSSRQIEVAIEQDPGMVAKVLRVASSPYYGGAESKDIARAMSVIGINRMKQIAVGLAYQVFVNEKALVPAFDKLFFWEHCMLRAVIAREIMGEVQAERQFDAYTAGLILDVGLLAMDRFIPYELGQSITCSVSNHMPLLSGEERVCGFNHRQVGHDLATKWKLPAFIQEAILYGENPGEARFEKQLCQVLAVANTVTYEMGYPPIRGVMCDQVSEQFLPAINITPEAISEIANRALEVVAEAKKEMVGRKAA